MSLLYTLVWLSCLHIAMGATGVNFIPQKQTFTSFSTWALSLTVDLNPYLDHIELLNNTINDFEHEFSNIFNDDDSLNNTSSSQIRHQLILQTKADWTQFITSSVNEFRLDFSEISHKLHDMTRVFTNTISTPHTTIKSKRSILPWAGNLLSVLFGTATEDNLNRLKGEIGQLQFGQEEIIHVVSNSLTLVNKTNKQVAENRHTLNSLINATDVLRSQLADFESLSSTLYGSILKTNSITTHTHTAFNAVKFALRQTRNLIHNLHLDFQQIMGGKLPITFIDPDELTSILSDIRHNIPSTLTLPPIEDDDLLWFYRHLPTTLLTDFKKIHVIIMVPLVHTDSLFTIYKIVSTPVPIPNTNKASKIDLEGNYLAVSTSGNYYSIMSDVEAIQCPKFEIGYCALEDAAHSITRSPSCLSSLFLNEQALISSNCHVHVSENVKFPLIKHLSKGRWLIAANFSFIIHSRCSQFGNDDQQITFTPPVDTISLDPGCAGFSEYAKFTPYYYSFSERNHRHGLLDKLDSNFVSDDIWKLNDSSYTYLYTMNNVKPELPQLLSEFSGINFDHLQQSLELVKQHRVYFETNNYLQPIIITIIIILVALFIASFLYYRKNVTRISQCKSVGEGIVIDSAVPHQVKLAEPHPVTPREEEPPSSIHLSAWNSRISMPAMSTGKHAAL